MGAEEQLMMGEASVISSLLTLLPGQQRKPLPVRPGSKISILLTLAPRHPVPDRNYDQSRVALAIMRQNAAELPSLQDLAN